MYVCFNKTEKNQWYNATKNLNLIYLFCSSWVGWANCGQIGLVTNTFIAPIFIHIISTTITTIMIAFRKVGYIITKAITYSDFVMVTWVCWLR